MPRKNYWGKNLGKKNLIGFLTIFLLLLSIPIASSGETEHVWSGNSGITESSSPFDPRTEQLEFVEISNDKLAIVAEDQNITISFYSTNPAEKTMPTKASLKKIGTEADLSTDHTQLGNSGHKWGYRLKLPNQKFKATALIESTTPIEITDANKGKITTDFAIISFEDVLEYGYAVETTQLNATTAIISITKDYQSQGIKPNDWIYIDPTAVVSTESTSSSLNPTIAVDETNIHIAWSDYTIYDEIRFFRPNIFYKTKLKTGNWGTNTEIVSTENMGFSDNPTIAVDETNIHIAWMENYKILFKTKTKGGSWGTNTEIVSTESTGRSNNPTIAVDKTNIHIAWYDNTNYNGSGIDSDIFYKTKRKGRSWGTNTEVVSTENTSSSQYPAIAVDKTNIHIAWRDNYKILFKTKTKGGSWGTNAEIVSTESTGHSNNPTIAVDKTNIYIAWEDYTDYSGSGTDNDIFFKTKTKGRSWGTNTEIVSTESTYYSYWPAIAIDETNIYISWANYTGYSGSGTNYDIFYKTKTKGRSWGTNTEIVSTESINNSGWSAIAVDETNIHIAWDDYTNYGGSGIDWDIFYKALLKTETDLFIEWIKPIQVVEDVPLVAGKATVVRVKVVNNGPSVDTSVKINYNGWISEQDVHIDAFDFEIVDFYPPNSYTN